MTSSIIPQAGNLTVILSAELDWHSDKVRQRNTEDLRARLAKQFEYGELYSVLQCQGSYKGEPEKSFAITGPEQAVLLIGRKLAYQFRQESVLVVNEHGGGCLLFTDNGHQQAIGRYQSIGGQAVPYLVAWTRVVATGETFTFS